MLAKEHIGATEVPDFLPNYPEPDRPKCCNHQCNEIATVFVQLKENVAFCKKCYWAFNIGCQVFRKSVCPFCGQGNEKGTS